MSTLKANIIDSAVSTEFKKSITANGAAQWIDTFGVIKTNRDTISEDVTIPADTNGLIRTNHYRRWKHNYSQW